MNYRAEKIVPKFVGRKIVSRPPPTRKCDQYSPGVQHTHIQRATNPVWRCASALSSVGSHILIDDLALLLIVATVDGVTMVTVATGDRRVLERNVKGAVDRFKGAPVNVVCNVRLRSVAA